MVSPTLPLIIYSDSATGTNRTTSNRSNVSPNVFYSGVPSNETISPTLPTSTRTNLWSTLAIPTSNLTVLIPNEIFSTPIRPITSIPPILSNSPTANFSYVRPTTNPGDKLYGLGAVVFICVTLSCAMSFAGMCKLKRYMCRR